MARASRPLSQRLKSLAQRAGLPADESTPAAPPRDATDAAATVAAPDAPLVPAPKPAAHDARAPDPDEQPTGEIPVVGEAETSGPTLPPPTVPPSSSPGATTAPDAPTDEPFASGTAIWPQTTPTPRFAPPELNTASDPTFPEASPAPAEADESSLAPVAADESSLAPAAPPEPPAAPLASEQAEPGADTTERAVEVTPTDDADDQPAVPTSTASKVPRVFRGLRRPAKRAKHPSAAPAPAAAGSAPSTPTPADDGGDAATNAPAPSAPAPTVVPAAPLPAEKPSFGERAALRRRAKTLRARRDAGLLELGAIVLDQRRFGDPTGGSLMRRRTDELGDIDSELAAIEQALDDDGPAQTVAQLGVARCLSCSALVGARDRFCAQCGAPRPDDAAAPKGS